MNIFQSIFNKQKKSQVKETKQRNQQEQYSCLRKKQQSSSIQNIVKNALEKENMHHINRLYQQYEIINKNASLVDKIFSKNTKTSTSKDKQSELESQILYLRKKQKDINMRPLTHQSIVHDHFAIKLTFPSKKLLQDLLRKIYPYTQSENNKSNKLQYVQLIQNFYIQKISTFCSSYFHFYAVFQVWQQTALQKISEILISNLKTVAQQQRNVNKKISLRNVVDYNRTSNISSNISNNINNNPSLHGGQSNYMNSHHNHFNYYSRLNSPQIISQPNFVYNYNSSSTSTLPSIRNIFSPHLKLVDSKISPISSLQSNQQIPNVNYLQQQNLQRQESQNFRNAINLKNSNLKGKFIFELQKELLKLVFNGLKGLQAIFNYQKNSSTSNSSIMMPHDLSLKDIIILPQKYLQKKNINQNNHPKQYKRVYSLLNPLLSDIPSLQKQLNKNKQKAENQPQQSSRNLSQTNEQQIEQKIKNKQRQFIQQSPTYFSPEDLSPQFNLEEIRSQSPQILLNSFLFKLGMIGLELWIWVLDCWNENSGQNSGKNKNMSMQTYRQQISVPFNMFDSRISSKSITNKVYLMQNIKHSNKQAQLLSQTKTKPNQNTKINWLQLNLILENIINPTRQLTQKSRLLQETSQTFYFLVKSLLNRSALQRRKSFTLINNQKFIKILSAQFQQVKENNNRNNYYSGSQYESNRGINNFNNSTISNYQQYRPVNHEQNHDKNVYANDFFHQYSNLNSIQQDSRVNQNRMNIQNTNSMSSQSNFVNYEKPMSSSAQTINNMSIQSSNQNQQRQIIQSSNYHYCPSDQRRTIYQPNYGQSNLNSQPNYIDSYSSYPVHIVTSTTLTFPGINRSRTNNAQTTTNSRTVINETSSQKNQSVVIQLPQSLKSNQSQTKIIESTDEKQKLMNLSKFFKQESESQQKRSQTIESSKTNPQTFSFSDKNNFIVPNSYIKKQLTPISFKPIEKQSSGANQNINVRFSQYVEEDQQAQTDNKKSQQNISPYRKITKMNSQQDSNQYIKIHQYSSQQKPKNQQLSAIKQDKQSIQSLQNNQNKLSPLHHTTPISHTQELNISALKKSMYIPPHESAAKSVAQQSKLRVIESSPQKLQYVITDYRGGAHYEGFVKNNKRNGHGKFFYPEGSYYDGEWIDDKMEGYGLLYYKTGELAYEGEWINDSFHGQGKVYNNQPTMLDDTFDFTNFNNLQEQWVYYEGQLKNDLKWGHGIIMLENGQWFQGEFQNDQINGQGKFVNLEQQIIKGRWRDSILIQRIYQD